MAIAPITISDISSGGAGFYFWGPFLVDYMGKSVASAGDINGDGYEDIIVGTPGRDGAGGSSPGNPGITPEAGAAWVLLGGPTQLSGNAFPSVVGLYGSWGIPLDQQALGWDVASAGDFNGDGYDDVIVSFPSFSLDGGRTRPGASYLVLGNSDPETLFSIARVSATGAYTYILGQGSDFSGFSVAGAGDVNADGFDDLIIGAPQGTEDYPSGRGMTYVVYGHSGAMPATISLDTIAAGSGGFVIRGIDAGDRSGASVSSPGDVNGDGIADILISAPGGDGNGNAEPNGGEAYVVFGRTDGFGSGIDLSTVAAGTGGFALYGEDGALGTGFAVSGAGDINNDGLADILISAKLNTADPFTTLSEAYVVFGQSDGFGPSIDLSAIAAGNGGFRLREEEVPEFAANWNVQWSVPIVGALGDVNGDGIDDFSFSGFQNYVIFGRADGFGTSLDLDAIAAGTGGFLVPSSLSIRDTKAVGAWDFANGGVSGAGDIDGDGFDDIIVGDPYANPGPGAAELNDLGAVYVIYGRDFTGSVTHAGTAGNNGLIGTGAADDMVGGQGNDILIGAGGADVLIGGSGNDVLEVGDRTFVRVDGGTGTDILRINQIVALDLRAIPDTRIKDIEVITLRSPGASLILTQREVLNISSTSNTLTVNGASGIATTNTIRFDYWNWTKTGPSGGYDVYTNGGATLKVDPLIVVAGVGTGTDGDDTIDAGARNDALSGLAGNDTLNGGAGNDALDGGSGNDTLVGGTGNDSMKGGAGDDTYSVDATGDTVVENLNEGDDTVNTSRNSYTLGSNVENLTFVGTGAFAGTGNALMNRIVGGTGNDTLGGSDGDDTLDGGTGADSMSGGADSDIYFVDDAGDTVIENLDEGTDTVKTSLNSDTLGDNVENLTFLGSGAFTGTGNALTNRIVSGTGDDMLDGGTGADSMSGGAGNDVYFADDAGDAVIENLDEGTDTVKTSLNSDTLGDNVENLTFVGSGPFVGTGNSLVNEIVGGTGNDMLSGAGDNDTLDGGGGDDTLDGGTGADSMRGGAGNDVYLVDDGGDAVIENLDEGADIVNTSLNIYTLDDNVENLTFGGIGDFAGSGNSLENTITGSAGKDKLNGKGGADFMAGGGGNDVYYVDGAGDQVLEGSGAGTDTVYATVDWTIAAGQEIERLRAYGDALTSGVSLTGNGFATYLIGGAGLDHLTGGAGMDRLDGKARADVMAGGDGNDTYYVDDAGDQVLEGSGASTDTVYAAVDWTIAAGQEVERLRAYGDALTSGVSLTGNGFSTYLIGGAGIDHLTGGADMDRLDGKAGADVLAGGGDDDIYYVDDAGDQVTEDAGSGVDTVRATVDWTMTAGQEIERLRAYGDALTSGVSLTANGFGTYLTGGAGIDHLTGGAGKDRLDGKEGADVLAGGGDDDIYYVDDAGDQVTEDAGSGVDTVRATVDWTMTAGQEIETLRVSGAAGLSLAGNELDNVLIGGSGNDRLYGGDGNDWLTGGAGADVFAASFGRDIVRDFSLGSDRLDVSAFHVLDFANVMAATTDVGTSVVVTLYTGTSITLNGVQKSQLQAADIIL